MSGMVSHYKQYRNVLNGDPEHLGSVKLVPLGDTLGGGVSLISHHLPCGLIMACVSTPQTDNVRKGGWVWGGVEGGGYQLSPWLVAWSLSIADHQLVVWKKSTNAARISQNIPNTREMKYVETFSDYCMFVLQRHLSLILYSLRQTWLALKNCHSCKSFWQMWHH